MSSSIISGLPTHIYGLHDISGSDVITNAGRTGWLLDSVDVQAQIGTDYTLLTNTSLGLLVRLNNGYGATGTIPLSHQYDAFAARCASYVQNSPGARIWIIGNEMNTSAERPEFPDRVREVVTPQKYALCFTKCRNAIKRVAGHADDWVIPGAIGPYNAETGDWVQYLIDVLSLLQDQADGIALHCYTHDYTIDQIFSDDTMAAPFNKRHFNFRAYRDFLNSLPDIFRALPVFITETNPFAGWRNTNIGWIQGAYQEIDAWNADPARQPIQALVLFRWQTLEDHPEWGLQDKPALINDFRAALASGYRTRWTSPPAPATPATPPPSKSDYLVAWNKTIPIPNNAMETNSKVTGIVTAKNIGTTTWFAKGANPVRLGYRWYNAQGTEVSVAAYAGNFSMSRNVAPGETATFENVELAAPQMPGIYTLKWDLVHEGITWFSPHDGVTQDAQINVSPPPPAPPSSSKPRWQVKFLAHDTPVSERGGQTIVVNLCVKNTGTKTWLQGDNSPVHIGYKWFDAAGQQQLDVEDRRTALPSDVAPDQNIALGAILVAPKKAGDYNLRWDLVAEGVTWFADADGEPLVIPVHVTSLPIDISGWRAEANVNASRVALALDGDPRTFWDSGTPQAPGQWFRLNLGAPRTIDGVQFLSPGKGFPAAYSLRASSDGAMWIELARITGDDAHDVLAIFAPMQIQYLQIDLLTASPSNWMISEILVHSAAPWIARSSHDVPIAGLAIDNQPDTAWSSGEPQSPGMWFQIDLGRVETVSGIALDGPENAIPVAFRITTWNAAASRWQIAQEVKDNHTPVDVAFSATQTQFVNVQVLATSDKPWTIQHAHVIREMETWLGPSK